MFVVEFHCHARTGSCDSKFDEKSLVKVLKEYGYDGFVLSNHYGKRQLVKYSYPRFQDIICPDNHEDFVNCPFEQMSLEMTEEQMIQNYHMWIGSMKLAKALAEQHGIKFYAGMEYTLDTGQHVGVLGCTVEEFDNVMLLPEKDIHYLAKYVHDRNGVIIQNHPFRDSSGVLSLVDGYECVNTKHMYSDVFSESEFNQKTGRLGIFTCGCDIHTKNEIKRSYTAFKEQPKDEKELAEMLRNGQYYNYIAKDLNNLSEGYKLCEV